MKASSRRGFRPVAAVIPLAAVLLSPGEARARERPEVEAPFVVGSRIRLRAPRAVEGRIQGSVMELDEKSVLISTDDRIPLRIPREAITQLEVSTGLRRQTLKGALIGAGVGAGLSALVPWEDYCGGLESDPSCPSKAESVVVGAGGGAVWGVLVGLMVKGDRWGKVPLEGVRLSVVPARGHGVGVTLTASW